MISGLPKALADEFERSAADVQRRKILLREQFMWEADQDKRDQRKKREEKEERDRERLEIILATSAQLTDFTARLDRYDTATVEALLDNQRALDRIHERLEQIRANAHVLPDGRRVFPTLKGDAVYDESGALVGRDVIDPQAIQPGRSTWEDLVAATEERKQLNSERGELLTFQAKLDASRERVAAGGLTTKEISDLDADLRASMPGSISSRVPQDPTGPQAAPSTATRSEEAMATTFGKPPPPATRAYLP